MRNELTLSFSTLYAFLLVLTRFAGVFVFVPLPGTHAGPGVARAVAALGCTMAMAGSWPTIAAENVTPGTLTGWVLSEAALGILAGLTAAFLTEALLLGMQILSLQAGYSYASTIDPTSQADSAVLTVIAQLFAGLIFFAIGMDRLIVLALAKSLGTWPPGTFSLTLPMAEQIIRLASHVFSTGLRIALPVTGLLVMVDLALALLVRMHMQLQVTTIAFPVKMMAGLFMLACIAGLFPSILEHYAHQSLGVAQAILSHK